MFHKILGGNDSLLRNLGSMDGDFMRKRIDEILLKNDEQVYLSDKKYLQGSNKRFYVTDSLFVTRQYRGMWQVSDGTWYRLSKRRLYCSDGRYWCNIDSDEDAERIIKSDF